MTDGDPISLANRLPETLRSLAEKDRSNLTPLLARAVEAQLWIDTIATAPFVDPYEVPEWAESLGRYIDEDSPTGTCEVYRVSETNDTSKDKFVKVSCKE